MKYDYAVYTSKLDRENDMPDWYDTCADAMSAARAAIAKGSAPEQIGIMKFERNGDCAWDAEITFDAEGAAWSDDYSAREEMGCIQ